jgi:hypothetical protein
MENTELTKEELILLLAETTKQIKGIQTKIDKLDEFYKENLVDEGENLSTQTKLKKTIENANGDAETIRNVKSEVEQFKAETFVGTEENPSTKKTIDDILNDIKVKQQSIDSAHKHLLENEEGRESLNTQITNLKNEIEKFKIETLIDEDEKVSTKTSVKNLIVDANKLIADSQKANTDIETKHIEISSAQKLLLIDEDGHESVKTQIIKIKDDFTKNLTESDKEIKDLKRFHKKVFEKTGDEETGTEQEGLKVTVENLANRLSKLTTEAEKRLFGLTDSSLQHAFASRAKAYTIEFEKLQQFTYKLTWFLIIDIIVFGVIELILIACGKSFDYHLLIYQFSIAGALIFAMWMFNRNQKIAKKLAEDYHHKASITEAMTGYRELYGLEHKNPEYMELFTSLIEQLNTNPSKGIDTFLNLKSPHEELTSSVKDFLNPENLTKIKELIK